MVSRDLPAQKSKAEEVDLAQLSHVFTCSMRKLATPTLAIRNMYVYAMKWNVIQCNSTQRNAMPCNVILCLIIQCIITIYVICVSIYLSIYLRRIYVIICVSGQVLHVCRFHRHLCVSTGCWLQPFTVNGHHASCQIGPVSWNEKDFF